MARKSNVGNSYVRRHSEERLHQVRRVDKLDTADPVAELADFQSLDRDVARLGVAGAAGDTFNGAAYKGICSGFTMVVLRWKSKLLWYFTFKFIVIFNKWPKIQK